LRFGATALDAVAKLPNEVRGWIIGKQLGRAATSIGANVWEADAALTDSEFAHKISIARKEACETEYWLDLARTAELLPLETYTPLVVKQKNWPRYPVRSSGKRKNISGAQRVSDKP